MNWNITAGRQVYVQLVEQLELALVAGEFLHQVEALGLPEAEVETLLRASAQQAPKKGVNHGCNL